MTCCPTDAGRSGRFSHGLAPVTTYTRRPPSEDYAHYADITG